MGKTWHPRQLALGTLAVALAFGVALPARGQALPTGPLVLADGRLTIAGGVSATFSCAQSSAPGAGDCADDTGFFNYTDYEHSALRMVRFDIGASLKAGERLTVLGELRSENIGIFQPYALYVRFKPWAVRGFALQVGRLPPTFGTFARRSYPSDNLLIGYPLAYQYLTSLRADALPATADELLRMRGRGWLSSFSVGNPAPDRGVPLVSASRWDTGVQAHVGSQTVDATVSVTMGTLANPLVKDDNAGKQVSGRLAFHPGPGLLVGVSAAHGAFVAQSALTRAGIDPSGGFGQTAWGGDVEYSRDYFLVRFEAIVSDWRLPVVMVPIITLPLRATSTSAEGRYKIRPGFYAAARVDHLGFSEVSGTGRRDNWDAPVTRVEVGGGYSLQRNLVIKVSFQQNKRESAVRPKLTLVTAQANFWF